MFGNRINLEIRGIYIAGKNLPLKHSLPLLQKKRVFNFLVK